MDINLTSYESLTLDPVFQPIRVSLLDVVEIFEEDVSLVSNDGLDQHPCTAMDSDDEQQPCTAMLDSDDDQQPCSSMLDHTYARPFYSFREEHPSEPRRRRIYVCPDCPYQNTHLPNYEKHRWNLHDIPIPPDKTERKLRVHVVRINVEHLLHENHLNEGKFVDNITPKAEERSRQDCQNQDLNAKIKPKRKQRPGRKYRCTVCRQQLGSWSLLMRHSQEHADEKPYQCTICCKRFTSASNLRNHRMLHNSIQRYQCRKCLACFTWRKLRDQHMKEQHGSGRKVPSIQNQTKQRSKQQYTCRVRKRNFGLWSEMKKHSHKHKGEKAYQCQCTICLMMFTNLLSLKKHAMAMDGEERYRCCKCSRQFTSYKSFAQHLKDQHGVEENANEDQDGLSGEKPATEIYSKQRLKRCRVCDKKFAVWSDLIRHSRQHGNEKLYECVFCKKRFATADYRNKHCKTIHSVYRSKVCLE